MQLLSYISILSTLYSMQILIVSVLTDKLYSNHGTALYDILLLLYDAYTPKYKWQPVQKAYNYKLK